MFKVKNNFAGSFKVSDNIEYNCKILNQLYEYFKSGTEEQKKHLCKPITVIIVSIIEAMLSDFIEIRVKYHTKEGIKGISDEVLEEIRKKRISKMSQYIDCIEKYKLFGKTDYESLHSLRKLRNRIHIQNIKDFESNESEAFTENRKEMAEKILEKIAKILSTKYPRPDRLHYCADFEFPWQEHLNKRGFKKA